MSDRIERCINCDDPTECAGIADDSLYYDDGRGPFCRMCYYQTDAPETIYLQMEDEEGNLSEEITWCKDQINDTDVKYKKITDENQNSNEIQAMTERIKELENALGEVDRQRQQCEEELKYHYEES